VANRKEFNGSKLGRRMTSSNKSHATPWQLGH